VTVRTETNLSAGRGRANGYQATTGHGGIRPRSVVIATGACNRPAVPACASALPPDVQQLTPFVYRNPSRLPDGGVLVAGASATGVQLAAELRQAGRPVVLSGGGRVRRPRTGPGPGRA